MQNTENGAKLSALFVDFDNIYLSLRKKSEAAATRFVTDPAGWLAELENGALITGTDIGKPKPVPGRMVIRRIYGNPSPRRDDRQSFSWVRNHFVRAGFEVIDCPPLTNQLKNSSDIRMALDIQDFLEHRPIIHQFIILSSDADFVPVLLRLRAKDRCSVIFTNQQTAASYEALCDGMVSEDVLIAFLSAGQIPMVSSPVPQANTQVNVTQPTPQLSSPTHPVPQETQEAERDAAAEMAAIRDEIMAEVADFVRNSPEAVPIEQLATHLRNTLGRRKTVDTRWAGYHQFRLLLEAHLPKDLALTRSAPYLAYHRERHALATAREGKLPEPSPAAEAESSPQTSPETPSAEQKAGAEAERVAETNAPSNEPPSPKALISQVIEITRLPPLPAELYGALFKILSEELAENGFKFTEIAENAAARAKANALPLETKHFQFVLDAIRATGHWFEKTDSAELLAHKFRDYVLSRCLSAGLKFGLTGLDLLDAWLLAPSAPVTSGPDQTPPGGASVQTAADSDDDMTTYPASTAAAE